MEKEEFFIHFLSERTAFTDYKLHLEFLKEMKFKRRKKLIEDMLKEKIKLSR